MTARTSRVRICHNHAWGYKETIRGIAMLDAAQRSKYLERIGFTEEPEPTREVLDALVCAHQMRIPFSTVALHRAGVAPDLSVDALYEKVMEQGLGGYCFELNKLFQELLETLGYAARPVLSRAVRGRESRMPINHRGILVELDGAELSVDVGFGGPMPAGALLLEDGAEQEVLGETYITERAPSGWWKICRMTKAAADLHDDGVPARRQTELELCTAHVEDIDFAALSEACSKPGTLFRDHEVVNLRTPSGHKAYMDGTLTVRENGQKTMTEFATATEQDAALVEHFGMRLA